MPDSNTVSFFQVVCVSMPWIDTISDPHLLRRCIRDLLALSTLPAVWTSYDPQQIGDSIAAALIAMLDADFVYVAIPANTMIEAVRVRNRADQDSMKAVRSVVHTAIGHLA